jgi:pimeloyl-ACP methyl ester carboxylesterase
MAEDMAAVLAHAGADGAAHVVGQSMGGMIAQELAIRHPGLVHSMVLMSTYAVADEWSSRVLRARRRILDEMGFGAQVEVGLLFVFSPKALLRIGDVVHRIERGLAERPPDLQGYAAQMDFCLAHDAVDRLGAVHAPTLVLSGAEDTLTSRFAGLDLAAWVPGATFRAVPEASHALLWEEPELVGQIVGDFISDAEAPRP